MGWTFHRRPKGLTNAEWLQHELLGTTHELVAIASKRSVIYAALRRKGGADVWGMVILTRWVKDFLNFGYKDMSEEMGPNECDCPASVLDVLTPTTHEFATRWRERCRANLERCNKARQVKPGAKVRFAASIAFRNGFVHDTFEFLRRSTFRGQDGQCYHITRWRSRSFQMV